MMQDFQSLSAIRDQADSPTGVDEPGLKRAVRLVVAEFLSASPGVRADILFTLTASVSAETEILKSILCGEPRADMPETFDLFQVAAHLWSLFASLPEAERSAILDEKARVRQIRAILEQWPHALNAGASRRSAS